MDKILTFNNFVEELEGLEAEGLIQWTETYVSWLLDPLSPSSRAIEVQIWADYLTEESVNRREVWEYLAKFPLDFIKEVIAVVHFRNCPDSEISIISDTELTQKVREEMMKYLAKTK